MRERVSTVDFRVCQKIGRKKISRVLSDNMVLFGTREFCLIQRLKWAPVSDFCSTPKKIWPRKHVRYESFYLKQFLATFKTLCILGVALNLMVIHISIYFLGYEW